ncbi:MAG: hypothetical protein CM1200mP40_06030 [Gammaproteobacteria bacterium]|nr:MAG: hypothetical protein CM1200mP40_06030 [Gammaproteobacteria bacterium]
MPDVPLLVFGILSIGFFDRALRNNDLGFWVATGVCVALGLSTHYRFFFLPRSGNSISLFLCPSTITI